MIIILVSIIIFKTKQIKTFKLNSSISTIYLSYTMVSSVQEVYTNFTEADFTEIYEVQKKLFHELKYW